MIHPKVREAILDVIKEPFVFPEDLVEAIKRDPVVWQNYVEFPEAYKRIRLAYIHAARKRPLEFKKRLDNFISKTRENKLIGYGGIDKFYK